MIPGRKRPMYARRQKQSQRLLRLSGPNASSAIRIAFADEHH